MKTSLPHDAYEKIADKYAEITDIKPHNAYYERHATKSLIQDINGKRIADIGCGTGAYTEWLVNHGAKVVAIEANEKMLSHAQKRVGKRAKYYLANMEKPFTEINDNTFDGIVSALAITYEKNHSSLFAEIRRILRHNGWLIFSTEHPFSSYNYFNLRNYFETKEVSCYCKGFGKRVRMKSYHHSLGSICDALYKNGFIIERIIEPKPIKNFKESDPIEYKQLMKIPIFICIRARKIR